MFVKQHEAADVFTISVISLAKKLRFDHEILHHIAVRKFSKISNVNFIPTIQ